MGALGSTPGRPRNGRGEGVRQTPTIFDQTVGVPSRLGRVVLRSLCPLDPEWDTGEVLPQPVVSDTSPRMSLGDLPRDVGTTVWVGRDRKRCPPYMVPLDCLFEFHEMFDVEGGPLSEDG